MADLIKKVRTASGDLQIDYKSLANLPSKLSQFTNDSGYVNQDEVIAILVDEIVSIIKEQNLENVTADTITANKVVGAVYE